MNKFAAAGLFAHAASGKRIIILAQRGARISDEMHEFDDLIPNGPAVRVTHAPGNQHIDLVGGGSIRFVSRTSDLRGRSADVVYVDGDIDQETYQHAAPVIASSHRGEIVRA